jgi:hypothetical protein
MEAETVEEEDHSPGRGERGTSHFLSLSSTLSVPARSQFRQLRLSACSASLPVMQGKVEVGREDSEGITVPCSPSFTKTKTKTNKNKTFASKLCLEGKLYH